MSDSTAVVKAPLRGGSAVTAIIPTDLDQVWRLAQMAAVGKMAPKSLVDGKNKDEAIAACAIAILAGAELGLTPLMALRSYAVVNGRPSLWGDGIKAVVRQSGRCEYIRTGSDQTLGWCEAKRSDTGETKRVEFTFEQAKLAGLDKKSGPWSQGYRDVMMERRATNRCLNDLFADVLGGIVDADEAMEDGPIVDAPQPTRSQPPAPPPEEEAIDVEEFDADKFVTELIGMMNDAQTEDDVVLAWEMMKADEMLSNSPHLDDAYDARQKRLAQFEDAPETDGFEEQQREEGMANDREREG